MAKLLKLRVHFHLMLTLMPLQIAILSRGYDVVTFKVVHHV